MVESCVAEERYVERFIVLISGCGAVAGPGNLWVIVVKDRMRWLQQGRETGLIMKAIAQITKSPCDGNVKDIARL